jgi:hypothetical protein
LAIPVGDLIGISLGQARSFFEAKVHISDPILIYGLQWQYKKRLALRFDVA